jgi:osmotically-inducible protein OsmY
MQTLESALEDRVQLAIVANPYLAGRNLRFETQEGRVTLHGVVSSFFQKQMAQEVLRRIDGVAAIENHLEVSWDGNLPARLAEAIVA